MPDKSEDIAPFQPYKILGFAGLLFHLASYWLSYGLVEVQVFDEYYLMTYAEAFRMASLIFLSLFGAGYFTQSRLHSLTLSWLHVISTLVFVFLLLVLLFLAGYAYSPGFSKWNWLKINNNRIQIALVFLGISQFVYLINILQGLMTMKSGNSLRILINPRVNF